MDELTYQPNSSEKVCKEQENDQANIDKSLDEILHEKKKKLQELKQKKHEPTETNYLFGEKSSDKHKKRIEHLILPREVIKNILKKQDIDTKGYNFHIEAVITSQ